MVRCGITSAKAPPNGGYFGKAACTAAVSARNGPAGSGASHRTSSPNQSMLANRPPKPGTDLTAAAVISITAGVTCPGGTNGYNTVTWAGIPRPAERSSLARSRPTTGSASGTGTRIALSGTPGRPAADTSPASLPHAGNALSCRAAVDVVRIPG